MAKDKYFVLFGSSVNNIFQFIQKRPIRLGKNEITFKKKTYIVDFTQVIWRKNNKCYILIDVDRGQVMITAFKNEKGEIVWSGYVPSVSRELIDLILARKSAYHFISAIQQNMGLNWQTVIMIVIGVAIGFPFGVIVGPMITGGSG